MNDYGRDLSFFVSERRKQTQDAFLRRHSEAVLVRKKPILTTDDDDTTTVAAVRMPSRPPPNLGADGDALVTELRKKEGGVFANRIGVGRTRATDIWLPVPNVSKYHAYFERDPASGRYSVTDAGSKNGTVVNGERLAAKIARMLEDSAIISFGGCEVRFYSPLGFFHFLSKYG